MKAADEGFRAAGAFKTVQPNDRRAGFGFHGLSDFLCAGASEPEACGRERAELQEASAADALASQRFILRFKHRLSPFGEGAIQFLFESVPRVANGLCEQKNSLAALKRCYRGTLRKPIRRKYFLLSRRLTYPPRTWFGNRSEAGGLAQKADREIQDLKQTTTSKDVESQCSSSF